VVAAARVSGYSRGGGVRVPPWPGGGTAEMLSLSSWRDSGNGYGHPFIFPMVFVWFLLYLLPRFGVLIIFPISRGWNELGMLMDTDEKSEIIYWTVVVVNRNGSGSDGGDWKREPEPLPCSGSGNHCSPLIFDSGEVLGSELFSGDKIPVTDLLPQEWKVITRQLEPRYGL
jgi:hypothetical protein